MKDDDVDTSTIKGKLQVAIGIIFIILVILIWGYGKYEEHGRRERAMEKLTPYIKKAGNLYYTQCIESGGSEDVCQKHARERVADDFTWGQIFDDDAVCNDERFDPRYC